MEQHYRPDYLVSIPDATLMMLFVSFRNAIFHISSKISLELSRLGQDTVSQADNVRCFRGNREDSAHAINFRQWDGEWFGNENASVYCLQCICPPLWKCLAIFEPKHIVNLYVRMTLQSYLLFANSLFHSLLNIWKKKKHIHWFDLNLLFCMYLGYVVQIHWSLLWLQKLSISVPLICKMGIFFKNAFYILNSLMNVKHCREQGPLWAPWHNQT